MTSPDVVRSPFGAVGALCALGGFAVLAGVEGVVAGVVVGLCWYLLPSTYAFGIGQLLAAAFATPVLPLDPFLVMLELGLFGVLLGPLLRRPQPARSLAVGVSFAFVLLLIAGGVLLASGNVGYAVAALLVALITGAAVLSSYELPRPGEGVDR